MESFVQPSTTLVLAVLSNAKPACLISSSLNRLVNVRCNPGHPPFQPLDIYPLLYTRSTGSDSEASGEQHSNALKDAETNTFNDSVSELDASCLELTPECIKQAQDTKTPEDVKQFFRDYGEISDHFQPTPMKHSETVFAATRELRSTRSLTTTEKQDLVATRYEDSRGIQPDELIHCWRSQLWLG